MKNKSKAYLAIILQSTIIGFSYLLVKISLKSTNTFNLLAHRFLFVIIALVVYRLLKPDSIKIKDGDWKKIAPYSIVYPVLFFLFQTLGLKYISSSESGIIYAMSPILTAIIAKMILKENLSIAKKIFMAISVIGVIYINLMNSKNVENYNFIGIIFIFISAVSFGTYNVMVKKLTKDYNTLTIVYIMSITSFVVFNIISIGDHLINGNIKEYFLPFTSISFVLSIVYLGICSSLITSLLATYALGNLPASTVGLFNNVSTVVSIVSGVIFLEEKLYYYHFIGIIAILFGTIGFNIVKTKNKYSQKQKTRL